MKGLRLPSFALPKLREWFTPLTLTVTAVSLLFGWYIVFGDQGLLMWRRLQHTDRDLRTQEVILSNRLQSLEEEKIHLTDPAYLEPIIRQQLGYVKSGEVVYQFTEQNTATAENPATPTVATTPEPEIIFHPAPAAKKSATVSHTRDGHTKIPASAKTSTPQSAQRPKSH